MHTNTPIIPYLEQYFGLWAMAEERFWMEFELARKFNVHLHLESSLPAQAKAEAGKGEQFDASGSIAVIGLHGKLMKQASSFGGGTSTVQVRRQIRAASRDPDIAGIMLHIDSPGGTVAGTGELAADVTNAAKRKPVYAFIEDLGASAAYWIASQASRISVNPTGQVGSIGTYGVVYDYSGAAAMEGVKAYVVRAGKFKGAGTPGTEITQELLAELQRNIDALNEHFIRGVASGRRMTLARVRELADGRVHVGSEAQEMGFVDAVESFDSAFTRIQSETRKRSKSMSMSDHVSPEAAIEEPIVASVASPAAIAAVAAPLRPQAATYAEIKAGCPGADADFICKQLEANATLAQAQQAWMAEQNRRIDVANENAKQAAVVKPGVQPIADGKGAATQAASGDSIAEWDAKVAELVKAGKPKHVATATVARKYPELRAAYVEAHNAKFTARR
jgi:signal peptide peptidase SppA